MINLESLEKVGNSKFGSHFTKPLYGDYCFSNIPETIKKTARIRVELFSAGIDPQGIAATI